MEGRAEFIEGFALELTSAGMQRMPARVFAAILTGPPGGLTARDLAELLDVSAASVSTATGYLTRTSLVDRVRRPGERVDRYETSGTRWAEAIAVETSSLESLVGWLRRGRDVVDDAAADRLRETQEFFEFLVTELPLLVQRWKESRA